MKKKFIGTILCFVFIITIVFGTLYVIDHKRMDNNLPVVFSTWGKKYVPPVNDYPIQNGVNSDEELNNNGFTETYKFNNLELEVTNVHKKYKRPASDGFDTWEYDVYMVSPGATITIKNADMWIAEDGKKHPNWAFNMTTGDRIDIVDDMKPIVMTDNMISVFDTESSVSVLQFEMYNKKSFLAEILEESPSSMIVEPVYEKMDAYIGEKVRIEYGTVHYDYLYGVGRRVVIYYQGEPEEIEDGMKLIKSDDISTEGFREFKLEVKPSEEKVKKEIAERTPPTDSSGRRWIYGNSALYYYGVENVLITIKGWTMPLEKALEEGRITLNGIIAKCNQDIAGGVIDELVYKDGGSQVYKYPEYTIVKYHTLDGNDDMYIGTPDIDIHVKDK